MDKKKIARVCVLVGIPLILYHLIVFLIPFFRNSVFWLAYGFTLAAFTVSGVALYIALVQRTDNESRFYRFPTARIGLIYLAAQFMAGLVFMVLAKWIPWWLTVLIQAFAHGAAAIGLVLTEAAAEKIQVQDLQLKNDVRLIRSLQSKANSIVAQCSNPEAKKAVRVFADDLRYSDPVSNPALEEAEQNLSNLVDALNKAATDDDTSAILQLCQQASAALAERNRLCKLHKNDK